MSKIEFSKIYFTLLNIAKFSETFMESFLYISVRNMLVKYTGLNLIIFHFFIIYLLSTNHVG